MAMENTYVFRNKNSGEELCIDARTLKRAIAKLMFEELKSLLEWEYQYYIPG